MIPKCDTRKTATVHIKFIDIHLLPGISKWVNEFGYKYIYFGKDFLGRDDWRTICQLHDCWNRGAWMLGQSLVCEEHRYGNNHILYKHHDESGHLIYVGITNDPVKRARGHKTSSEFWNLVTDGGYTTYKRYESREALLAAEREEIEMWQPRFNRHFNYSDVESEP